MTKNQAKKEVAKMIKLNNGKLFMGMTHELYGELRGLNFLIENPNIDEVLDFIDSQFKPFDEAELMRLINQPANKEPKNVYELNTLVWKKSMLAAQLLILPNSSIDKTENPPPTVSSLKEGMKEIYNVLRQNSFLSDKDPFFYRMGIS